MRLSSITNIVKKKSPTCVRPFLLLATETNKLRQYYPSTTILTFPVKEADSIV